MREFVKNLSKGLTIGLGFLIMLGVGYLAIKARQTANPGLTEGAPTGGLYVGSNETLSSAKRNVLVKRGTREDVATGDTGDFDTTCERRYQGKPNSGVDGLFYAERVVFDGSGIYNANEASRRFILKASKGTITSNDGLTRATVKLQKKCQ